MSHRVELSQRFSFEAAHSLPMVPRATSAAGCMDIPSMHR